MRTAAKCLALLALAQGAAAFAPFSALPIRNHALPATCAPRSLPVASRNARDMPLRLSGLQMAATNVPITITGTNIELTAALKAYVNDKVGGAMEKLGKKVISCNAMLTVDKNPSIEKNQAIEVVINVKGATLRTKELTHDMYASIDAAADSVKRKLRKYKEKIIDAHRTGRPEGAGFDASEIQGFEAFNAEFDKSAQNIPKVDMTLVKKKQFAMNPITTEEAILCLEYLDHDFYVYKNSANNKISVVYKRNSGGVGLIEPE